MATIQCKHERTLSYRKGNTILGRKCALCGIIVDDNKKVDEEKKQTKKTKKSELTEIELSDTIE